MYLQKRFVSSWLPAKDTLGSIVASHISTATQRGTSCSSANGAFSATFRQQRFVQLLLCFVVLSAACSSPKNMGQTQTTPFSIASAADSLLLNPALQSAHIGISIYDATTQQYLYEHDAEKYFVPASNTKLLTCYAAMKYLGDSLVGLGYLNMDDTTIYVYPTGDPSFLHSDFANHPVLDFLKSLKKKILISNTYGWKENALGFGWAWDDYNGNYMVERNTMPISGNTVEIKLNKVTHKKYYVDIDWKTSPLFFKKLLPDYYPLPLREKAKMEMDSAKGSLQLLNFSLKRKINENIFTTEEETTAFTKQEIPFHTNNLLSTVSILANDYNLKISEYPIKPIGLHEKEYSHFHLEGIIKSQSTDSVLKPMMHRSDNFFAEQLLLMVSNEKLGFFQDAAIIDTLLKTDLNDLPQKPKWVDGSGLSRYNLCTPQSFVQLLNKMEKEFGMERLKVILPTGGEGTISSLYKKYAGRIFAKTGTLSNQVALSGYIYTQQNKRLIFSVLVNNHMTTSNNVRKAVEIFLSMVMENE